MEMYGINYTKPEVILLQQTGLGVPEMAARTCYDSFDSSEHSCISGLNNAIEAEDLTAAAHYVNEINEIEDSSLLDNLAWTYFHHSILEHTNLSFLIKGTSRGVLQEHARHRIQAISVRSSRYTMSSIINAFVASKFYDGSELQFFTEKILKMDMFVISDEKYQRIEIAGMYDKLNYQFDTVPEFYEIAIAKSSMRYLDTINSAYEIFTKLEAGKKKRNVGDAFKHIISDNVKVDMVVTFNLRSLKNYFGLRDSGAAYFQIQWLAQEMKAITPLKYLKLIDKEAKKIVDTSGGDDE